MCAPWLNSGSSHSELRLPPACFLQGVKRLPMPARAQPTLRQAAAVPALVACALVLALLLPSAAAQGAVCNQETHIVASTPAQCGDYCQQNVPAGIMARPQTYTGERAGTGTQPLHGTASGHRLGGPRPP